MQPKPQRPTGVTILAILAIIGGVLGLLAALGLLGATATVASATGVASGTIVLLGAVSLVLGVADLVFGIGALQLKTWAWTLGIGLEALSIIENIVDAALKLSNIGSAIISIAIGAYIIYYLFRPNVQQAFGRAV